MSETISTPPANQGRHRPRAAFVFIFVTVLLDMLALGIVIPVLPALIRDFEGGDTVKAAHMVGLFGTVWAVMQFFFMPILGALSDKVGRRPVILLSNFGLALDYVIMALAPTLGWLLLGRVLSGATSASVTTAFAYVADVTAPDKRAAAFGALGAAFGLGFVIGPALGGLAGDIDARLPFWIAGGLGLLNGLYGLFILPESLPAERRSPFSWRKANPIASLAFLRAAPRLTGLATVKFLCDLAHVVYPSTFALYAMHRFNWGEKEVGLTLGAVGIAAVIVQGGLLGRIVKAIGETRALLLGLVMGATGFAIYGLAPTPARMFIGIPFSALWGLAGPSAQALMSKLVSPMEQGRLQGAVGGLTGFAGILGPTLFSTVFAYFIAAHAGFYVPGAAFVTASLLVLLSIPFALRGAKLAAQAEAAPQAAS